MDAARIILIIFNFENQATFGGAFFLLVLHAVHFLVAIL